MRIKEFFSLQHDKEYFDRLKTDINNNRKQYIIYWVDYRNHFNNAESLY